MKTIRNFIAAAGLVGLLGCGEEPVQAQKEDTDVCEQEVEMYTPITPPIIKTFRSLENVSADCSISISDQKDALFDELTKTEGTIFYAMVNAESPGSKEAAMEGFIRKERARFGRNSSWVAGDIVDYISGSRSDGQIEGEMQNILYQRAKALAACMDPKANFDEIAVKVTYERAVDHLNKGWSFSSVDNDIKTARQIAADVGIDNKPYEAKIAKAMYNVAEYRLNKGWSFSSVDNDIKTARQIAADAQSTNLVAKCDALEATLK